MIILTKKWENKTVYKTGRGSVNAWKVGDQAFIELDANSIKIKYLKSLYGFKEYKKLPIKPITTQVKKTKSKVSKPKKKTSKLNTKKD